MSDLRGILAICESGNAGTILVPRVLKDHIGLKGLTIEDATLVIGFGVVVALSRQTQPAC